MFRFGPLTGFPIGSSSPNRIGSRPTPPRVSPRTAARTIAR